MENNSFFVNPTLKSLSVIVGKWSTVGTHPLFPGKVLHGHASFDWIEGGAFLIMHSTIKNPAFPKGVAIFGYDDSTEKGVMICFDDRGVSRKYEWSFAENVLKWWRNAPGFSQCYSWTIKDNGNTIIGKGEISKDGSSWEKDLYLTYTRIKS